MDDQQPIEDWKAKYEECTAGWKRALADYDNLKKDLAKERVEMSKHATWRAAQSFLPVLDNFDAALKFNPATSYQLPTTVQTWLQGILFIRTQLEKALEDLGLSSFGAVGDTFDANLHEAVSEQEGGTPGAILEVIRRGWKLGDKVVREASVVVGK